MEIEKSPAPALERGLMLLETLSPAPDGLRFGELCEALTLSKMSMSRLLKVLIMRGYVIYSEDSKRYRLSWRTQIIGRYSEEAEQMAERAIPVLKELRDSCSNTVILMHWDEKVIHCLAKEIHPTGVAMQPVGRFSVPDFWNPWSWVIFGQLPTRVFNRRIKGFENMAEVRKGIAMFKARGYTYRNESKPRYRRRIAAPVYGENRKLIGILGMAGTLLTISNRQVADYGEALCEAGERLSGGGRSGRVTK